MKIWREIDGRKFVFELSDKELVSAYEEQRHKYVIEDVKEEKPDYPDGLACDVALEVIHQQDFYGCPFDVALNNVIPDFEKDLREDRIEHDDMQIMLENDSFATRMEKRNMESNKLALEEYWGVYLINTEKEL